MPAFPGAEGFGSFTRGGRGGRVIEVTNLNADGPGSLDAALRASGPRIVVFRVGGTIELTTPLVISEPFVTVAGQTAPGDGICLRGAGISIPTHDVVLRYLRIRPGDHPIGPKPGKRDAIGIGSRSQEARNIIIDHCSVSWTMDEAIEAWFRAQDITLQWCLISESLNDSLHHEGSHGYGVIIGSAGAKRVTMHHNLLAHHERRHPRFDPRSDKDSILDFRNNVIYNHGKDTFGILNKRLLVNYVGNTIKAGPNSGENPTNRLGMNGTAIYLYDNEVTAAPGTLVIPDDRKISSSPFDAPDVSTQSARAGFDLVMEQVGATLPVRDVVDDRVVMETRSGTGRFIDSQWDVGGWPEYASGNAPPDQDHDGMSDTWERTHGFDPQDPSDGNLDFDGDGYTNVEEYLNATNPRDAVVNHDVSQRPLRIQSGNATRLREAARVTGQKRRERQSRLAVNPENRHAFLAAIRKNDQEVGELLDMDFVQMEPGEFLMDRDDEWSWGPVRVTLSAYEISTCEVTQRQWEQVMGTTPWEGQPFAVSNPTNPASYLSWNDCQEFVGRMNASDGPWRYALPTSAQWERAARAGTGSLYGVTRIGEKIEPTDLPKLNQTTWARENTIDEGLSHPQPVGTREPNAWGIFDMSGNVLEWCQDNFDKNGGKIYWQKLKSVTDPVGLSHSPTRSCRGKSFYRPLGEMLMYSMTAHKPGYRSFETGFRLVRVRR